MKNIIDDLLNSSKDVSAENILLSIVSTDDFDIDTALKCMTSLYAASGNNSPEKYELVDSPDAAIKLMKTKYDFEVTSNDFIWDLDSYILTSALGAAMAKDEPSKLVNDFIDLFEISGPLLVFDDLIVFTHKPVDVVFDGNNYTLKYADGWEVNNTFSD